MTDTNPIFSMLDKDKKGYLNWEEFSLVIPELLKGVNADEMLDFSYEMGLGLQQEVFIYQFISNCFLIDYSAPCDIITGLITSIQDYKQSNSQHITSSMLKMIGSQNKVKNVWFKKANFQG